MNTTNDSAAVTTIPPFVDRAQYVKILGNGGYGMVIEVKLSNGFHVARKLFKSQTNALAEFGFCKLVAECPFFTHIYSEPEPLNRSRTCPFVNFFDYEVASNGSLHDVIRRKVTINEIRQPSFVLQWLVYCLQGLEFLHQRSVGHFDIKPSNLLIMGNGSLRIHDLGMAYSLNAPHKRIGTPAYRPPEAFYNDGRGYISSKFDIWSLGATFYFLVTLNPLVNHNDNDEEAVIREVQHYARSGVLVQQIPNNCLFHASSGLVSLIQSMLIIEPENRSSATELLNLSICRTLLSRSSFEQSISAEQLRAEISINHANQLTAQLAEVKTQLEASKAENETLKTTIQDLHAAIVNNFNVDDIIQNEVDAGTFIPFKEEDNVNLVAGIDEVDADTFIPFTEEDNVNLVAGFIDELHNNNEGENYEYIVSSVQPLLNRMVQQNTLRGVNLNLLNFQLYINIMQALIDNREIEDPETFKEVVNGNINVMDIDTIVLAEKLREANPLEL